MIDLNDPMFDAQNSNFDGQFTQGTAVYVQVDSANADTAYGAVNETHEIHGGAYNNIAFTTTLTK